MQWYSTSWPRHPRSASSPAREYPYLYLLLHPVRFGFGNWSLAAMSPFVCRTFTNCSFPFFVIKWSHTLRSRWMRMTAGIYGCLFVPSRPVSPSVEWVFAFYLGKYLRWTFVSIDVTFRLPSAFRHSPFVARAVCANVCEIVKKSVEFYCQLTRH